MSKMREKLSPVPQKKVAHIAPVKKNPELEHFMLEPAKGKLSLTSLSESERLKKRAERFQAHLDSEDKMRTREERFHDQHDEARQPKRTQRYDKTEPRGQQHRKRKLDTRDDLRSHIQEAARAEHALSKVEQRIRRRKEKSMKSEKIVVTVINKDIHRGEVRGHHHGESDEDEVPHIGFNDDDLSDLDNSPRQYTPFLHLFSDEDGVPPARSPSPRRYSPPRSRSPRSRCSPSRGLSPLTSVRHRLQSRQRHTSPDQFLNRDGKSESYRGACSPLRDDRGNRSERRSAYDEPTGEASHRIRSPDRSEYSNVDHGLQSRYTKSRSDRSPVRQSNRFDLNYRDSPDRYHRSESTRLRSKSPPVYHPRDSDDDFEHAQKRLTHKSYIPDTEVDNRDALYPPQTFIGASDCEYFVKRTAHEERYSGLLSPHRHEMHANMSKNNGASNDRTSDVRDRSERFPKSRSRSRSRRSMSRSIRSRSRSRRRSRSIRSRSRSRRSRSRLRRNRSRSSRSRSRSRRSMSRSRRRRSRSRRRRSRSRSRSRPRRRSISRGSRSRSPPHHENINISPALRDKFRLDTQRKSSASETLPASSCHSAELLDFQRSHQPCRSNLGRDDPDNTLIFDYGHGAQQDSQSHHKDAQYSIREGLNDSQRYAARDTSSSFRSGQDKSRSNFDESRKEPRLYSPSRSNYSSASSRFSRERRGHTSDMSKLFHQENVTVKPRDPQQYEGGQFRTRRAVVPDLVDRESSDKYGRMDSPGYWSVDQSLRSTSRHRDSSPAAKRYRYDDRRESRELQAGESHGRTRASRFDRYDRSRSRERRDWK